MNAEAKALVDEVNQKVADVRTLFADAKKLGEEDRGETKKKIEQLGAQVVDIETSLSAKLKELEGVEERINVKLQKMVRNPHAELGDMVVKTASGREVSNPPEFVAAWKRLCKHGHGALTFDELKTLTTSPWGRDDAERKALATDSDPSAGYFVLPTMEAGIEHRLLQFSPIRQFARIATVNGSMYEFIRRSTARFPVADIGERNTAVRNADITPLGMYEKVRIEVFESTTSPAVTLTAIEDAMVDLEAELTADAELDFLINEGRWFVSGSGFGEPQGFLTSSEVPQVHSGLATDITWNSLINLVTQLPTPYAGNAAFTFSRLTAGYFLQLQDAIGNYIWRPSQSDGMPSTLLGYKWFESINMPSPITASDSGPGGFAPGATPVTFANWPLFFRIVDRRGVRVIRDMLTQHPIVIFKMSKRVGGRVSLGEAGRTMVVSA